MSSTRLEIERFLPADCQTVFEAWTDPEIMAQWFFVGEGWSSDVTCQLRVGGSYSVTMHTPEGEKYWHRGTYREIEPPRRLVFTWNSELVDGTLVTVELEPQGSGTRLRLTHDLLETDDLRLAHRTGWTGCLGSLSARLTDASTDGSA